MIDWRSLFEATNDLPQSEVIFLLRFDLRLINRRMQLSVESVVGSCKTLKWPFLTTRQLTRRKRND